MLELEILKFILIVAVILSSTVILSRSYFLKRFNKVEIALGLIGLVFAIPSFAIINIDILYKTIIIIPIVVIILIIHYWENLKGENVTKKLGKPSNYSGKIQLYESRKDIPLEEIIEEANKELIILSLSNYELIKYNEGLLREAVLHYKLKVTIMILNTSSDFVDKQSYVVGDSLREDIIKSEKRLYELQEELSREKLIIEKYNFDLPYSLVVTDLNDDYSIVKIDEYIRK